MKEVCGTVIYEIDDIAIATRFVKNKSRRRGTYAAFVIVPILIIATSFLTNPAKAFSDLLSSWLLPILALPITLGIAYGVYVRKRRFSPVDRYLAGRAFRKSKFLRGDFKICFTVDGLRSDHELSSSLVRWPAYERVVETKDYLYFFGDQKSATLIPTRSFTFDDLGSIREMLAAHFQDKFASDL